MREEHFIGPLACARSSGRERGGREYGCEVFPSNDESWSGGAGFFARLRVAAVPPFTVSRSLECLRFILKCVCMYVNY